MSRLLSLLVAMMAIVFFPLSASADPGPDGYGGEQESITVSNPSPAECQPFTVTAEGGDAQTVTLTVTNDSGEVVYQQTKDNTSGDTVSFEVTLCAAGDYTLTATDEYGLVLAVSSVTVESAAGGSDAGSVSGSGGVAVSSGASSAGLPGTGATAGLVGLSVAGVALLLVGFASFARGRKRTELV